MKNLFKKFSYESLEELCKEKEWRIPSSKELMKYKGEMMHEWVWVNDEPTHDNADNTRKVLYSIRHNKTMQVNGKFMENCIVIKGE